MKIDIFNIDDFVIANHCEQITDPVFYDSFGSPLSKGLFSYEIFGMSEEERRNTFGYIDLGDNYLHPLLFNMITARMGSLKDIIYGKKFGIIADKKIKIVDEDTKGAETGLKFIYDNWEQIDWLTELEDSEIDSLDKKTRLKILKVLKKEEAFCRKWLVLPPYFREESADGDSLGDEINELYKSLIARTNAMRSGGKFSFFGEDAKLKIQILLYELFNETTRHLRGKNSMLRKHMMGKTIDYTASNVITAPQLSLAYSAKENPVPYGYCRFPIATLITLFQPFFVSFLSNFFSYVIRPIAEVDNATIDIEFLSLNNIEKILKNFIRTPEIRGNDVEIPLILNNKKITKKIHIYETTTKEAILNEVGTKRPLTYVDLMFIACCEACLDKHVFVTRYPVLDFQNIFPSKIKIASSKRLRKVYSTFEPNPAFRTEDKIKYFEEYPYIDFPDNPERKPKEWYEIYDVMFVGNAYLGGLDGDYDGDMVYMRGLYSKEANDEAENLVYAKTNFLQADGSLIRRISGIGKEAVMGLYQLTKNY